MGISSASKLCAVVLLLLLVALCHGRDLHANRTDNTLDVRNTTGDGVTPVLQHGYDDYDYNAPRGVVIVTPIVTLLLIGCCVYFCCRCRSQRSQGIVVGIQAAPHPPPPTTQTIVFQQQPAPAQQMNYPQQHVPPPAPFPQQHVPPPSNYPQQQVPPPYDTQPYPPPTAFVNPNYAPQPPVNTQYGQEKY